MPLAGGFMTAKHLYFALLALAFVALNGCAPSGDPSGDDETESPRGMTVQEIDSEFEAEDEFTL